MQREICDENSQSLMATSPTIDIEPLQSVMPALSFSSSFLKKSQISEKPAQARQPDQDERWKSRSFLFNQLKEQARLQEAERSMDSLQPVQIVEVDELVPDAPKQMETKGSKPMNRTQEPVAMSAIQKTE